MAAIEHFALYGADPHALARFYGDAFGLRVVRDNGQGNPPGYFLADGRGTCLELIGRPAGASGAPQRYVCHLAILVDDFDAARAALQQRGAVFETDTEVHNHAMRTAFFDDPEGNRVQIVWRDQPLAG